MTLEQLRLKHPRLVYKTYTITQDERGITITHEFLLEPDIIFRPTVMISFAGTFDKERLSSFAFHLGLVEAISYWKAACPAELVVEAGSLKKDQIRFWYDLFIHGLGEFFYRNKIDFTKPDFFGISSFVPATKQGSSENQPRIPGHTFESLSANAWNDKGGDLVLVGGGKDSAVSLGMMKESDRTIQTMVVASTSGTQAALDNIRVSGFGDPLVVERLIDPKLLELNKMGYLNGHTPFSAYLAFLGITVASLYGNENVIVSNEKSASEGNVMYRGLEVNHQYSKSFRFEQSFRAYVLDAFDAPANYFSLLRPLNDVQIGMIFSGYTEFFTTFRSCNVGSNDNVWCGMCPKCAFTFLTLSPFISREQLVASFGADVFAKPEIIDHIRALVGLTPVKPFECVGTRDEGKLALILTCQKYLGESREVPEGLLRIKSDLALTDADIAKLKESILDNWGDTYNLPPEHLSLLRNVWNKAREPLGT